MQQEQDIIEGCLRNERLAQKRLFDLFSKRMLSVCRYYTRNHDEAKDILQDSFIKVFRKIEHFQPPASIEAWIRRIVVNTAIDHYRQRKHQAHTDLEVAATIPESESVDVVKKMQADDIMQLVSVLPEGYRMVFSLYAIDGYNHREIGEMLGISEGTSKSQYARSRAYLQKMIKSYENSTAARQLQER